MQLGPKVFNSSKVAANIISLRELLLFTQEFENPQHVCTKITQGKNFPLTLNSPQNSTLTKKKKKKKQQKSAGLLISTLARKGQ